MLIFETPTRKGWLTIHHTENETPYVVQVSGDKELVYRRVLVPHVSEHATESDARQFAQGLYIGIECL